MDHSEEMLEQMSLALDGELSPEEQQQLEQHLEQCPDCRATYQQLKQVCEALGDLGEVSAPQNFASDVMERIQQERMSRKILPFWRRPQGKALAGLAACAVICVGLYYGAGQNGGLEQTTGQPMAAILSEEPQLPSPGTTQGELENPAGVPDQSEPIPSRVQDELPVDGGSSKLEVSQHSTDSASVAPSQHSPRSTTPEQHSSAVPDAVEYFATPTEESGVLVIASLPDEVADLLPPLEEWAQDTNGTISCSVSRETWLEILQALENAGVECSVLPAKRAGEFGITISQKNN